MRPVRPLAQSLIVAAALVLGAAAMAGDDKLDLSNKWRIEVSEGANSDGVIHFRITPKGGVPTDARVEIKDGRGENGVARDIRDGLRAALDAQRYHVETDDGEDVLVKKTHKGEDFELRLVESTVKSVRFEVEKE